MFYLCLCDAFPPGVPRECPQEGDGGASQADNALLVKQALHLLEDVMENVDLPASSKGVTKKGDYVYALFGHAGITFDTAQASFGCGYRNRRRDGTGCDRINNCVLLLSFFVAPRCDHSDPGA